MDFAKTKAEVKNVPRWGYCMSCGDLIGDDSDMPPEVQDQMKVHCLVCAKEVLGIAVPMVGSLQHDTGGGWRVIKETKTH